MAENTSVTRFSDLHLIVEERERVAKSVGDMIAIQVYRELDLDNELFKKYGIGPCCGDPGCSSCSSEKELLGR